MAPAAIMLVSAAISAGSQAYSGMAANAEGKSAQNMAKYNAQTAEQEAKYNASITDREARMTEQKTVIQQRQQAGEAERRQSTMIANMGASGVVSTSGTPLLIQAQQAEQDELQNLMIGFEGAEQARALRSQSALTRWQGKSEAGLQRMQGKQARAKGKAERTGAFIGAGGTLLSGFGGAFGGAKTGIGQGGTTGVKINQNTNYGQSMSRNFGN